MRKKLFLCRCEEAFTLLMGVQQSDTRLLTTTDNLYDGRMIDGWMMFEAERRLVCDVDDEGSRSLRCLFSTALSTNDVQFYCLFLVCFWNKSGFK